MNNGRRKELKAVGKQLREVMAKADELKGILEDIGNQLEEIKSAEEEYLENLPENLKNGDKASNAQEAIDQMCQVHDGVTNIVSTLEELDFQSAASELESL